MKISPRRRSVARHEHAGEPAILWWMPLTGLALATAWGLWRAMSSDDDRFVAFLEGLAWPGFLIFLVTTFLVWLAWKVELE